jgi:hypothetical protein
MASLGFLMMFYTLLYIKYSALYEIQRLDHAEFMCHGLSYTLPELLRRYSFLQID